MEINTIGRPRNVGWVRAAALIYGDWGTSKAYFIGLGVTAIGFAALPHLLCSLSADRTGWSQLHLGLQAFSKRRRA